MSANPFPYEVVTKFCDGIVFEHPYQDLGEAMRDFFGRVQHTVEPQENEMHLQSVEFFVFDQHQQIVPERSMRVETPLVDCTHQ